MNNVIIICINYNMYIYIHIYLSALWCAVVIWCDMLGGVLIGKEPLPWCGSICSHQIPSERGEARQTTQYSLLTRHVRRLNYICTELIIEKQMIFIGKLINLNSFNIHHFEDFVCFFITLWFNEVACICCNLIAI